MWFDHARECAVKSLCLRGKCGAIIVGKNFTILGIGWNSPPNNVPPTVCRKDAIKQAIIRGIKEGKEVKIHNATCCVHAEERAIINALENKPSDYIDAEDLFEGSSLYFVAIDEKGNIKPSGHPWCTRCSNLALDVGIEKWYIYHAENVWSLGKGIYVYSAFEYNEVSFEYHLGGDLQEKFIPKRRENSVL